MPDVRVELWPVASRAARPTKSRNTEQFAPRKARSKSLPRDLALVAECRMCARDSGPWQAGPLALQNQANGIRVFRRDKMRGF